MSRSSFGGTHLFKEDLLKLTPEETEKSLTARKLFRFRCGCGGMYQQIDVLGVPSNEVVPFGRSFVTVSCISCEHVLKLEMLVTTQVGVPEARSVLAKNLR